MTVTWQGPHWLKSWADGWGHTVFHHITSVDVRGMSVPESVLELEYLESIFLTDHAFSDKTLDRLRRMHRLKWIALSGSTVNDDALSKLAELSSLETVMLTATNVTDDGLARYNQIRPQVKIRQ